MAAHSIATHLGPEPGARAEFQRFLAWLAAEWPGGGRYIQLPARLERLLKCRGCDRPDGLADETLDRVAHKIDVVARNFEGDPAAYVHGVARRVFLEDTRRRARRRAA